VTCGVETPTGGSIGSQASASGSWVTGDFSASALAGAITGLGHGSSITSTGTVTLYDAGLVTLPSGMTSAMITLGVTGLSGTVGGGPIGPPGTGGFSSGDIITLSMIAGGSGGTSGKSVACLMDNLYSSQCPNGGFGFGFGPGALKPITLLVHNGDYLQLSVSVASTAFVAAYVAPEGARAVITVDPLYLMLPDGVTFDSGITDFLSGPSSPPSAPEPATLVLLAMGFAALAVVRRHRRA